MSGIAHADEIGGDWFEAGLEESQKKFVVFSIDDQHFCVDIMSVREIRAWVEETQLPNTSHVVRGVINLRGEILPIIDLRKMFGQGATQPTNRHVVLIVSHEGKLKGLLADAVLDIVSVNEEDIRSVPDSIVGNRQHFLSGILLDDDRITTIVALNRLIEYAITETIAA